MNTFSSNRDLPGIEKIKVHCELDRIIAPEIKNDRLYQTICRIAGSEELLHVLEIGSSAGGGSTEAFVNGLKENKAHPQLYCMEISKPRFKSLHDRYQEHPWVHCHNWSSVAADRFPDRQHVIDFYKSRKTQLNRYPLEQVLGWLTQDCEYLQNHPGNMDGIRRIKSTYGIDTFDLVLIDGSEFTGECELDDVYGARWIILDDIDSYKNFANYQRLSSDPEYRLVEQDWRLRNGYAVFKRTDPSPAIHFFTIVLNGEPFIRYHLEVFKQLNIDWHWHIVEGVANLKHDTAWSLASGGNIPSSCHRNGLSVDGTSQYLDEIAARFPNRITVYRRSDGRFWDGKLEMVNAPLQRLPKQCLLWQVDADELWTVEQIHTMHRMFAEQPRRTAAFFHCHFFVGLDWVTTTANAYSHHNGYEWLRVWRYREGMRWQRHEPPTLVADEGDGPVDVAQMAPFGHDQTEAAGLVFTHYAYVTESQVRFKQDYYGYSDAVNQWRQLQQIEKGPVRLSDHLAWVRDRACADRVCRRTIGRHVPPVKWNGFGGPATGKALPGHRPHLVIDGVIFQLQAGRPMGISRVWANLLAALAEKPDTFRMTVLQRSGSTIPVNGLACHPVPSYVMGDEDQLDADDEMIRKACADLKADLFISTYYTRAPGVTNIVMVHDLIPEQLGYDLTAPEWHAKQRTIETAAAFACVSSDTDHQLQRFYPHVTNRPHRVVPNAVAAVFEPASQQAVAALKHRLAVQGDYLLMVGNRGQYKNGLALLTALAAIPQARACTVLCIGGEPLPTAREKQLQADLDIRFVGRLSDVALAAAYTGAVALIFPSRCEGFGLPVVEAMACGCPVIATACAAVQEVGGQAFVPIDPDRPETVGRALAQVTDPSRRKAWARRGLDQVRQFSWQATAHRLIDLAHQALSQVPLVSAIVSTYNAERFLAGCLEDLEAQTMADRLEIIVVDSASPQGEGRIVREFQQRFPNIRYIRTARRESVYAAWNRGIKLARTAYVTNANTDDRHRRNAFEMMVSALEDQPEAVLAYGDVIKTATANETFDRCTATGALRWPDWDRNTLLQQGCFMGPQPLWRRMVHDVYGYFDERYQISADFEFWLRISQTFDFIHVPKPIGLYMEHEDSIEHADHDRKKTEDQAIYNRYEAAAADSRLIGYRPLSVIMRSGAAETMQAGAAARHWAIETLDRDLAQRHGHDDLYQQHRLLYPSVKSGRALVAERKHWADIAATLVLSGQCWFHNRRAAADAITTDGQTFPGNTAAIPGHRQHKAEGKKFFAAPDRPSNLKGGPPMELKHALHQAISDMVAQGKHQEAIWVLDKLLTDYPDMAAAHHDRAVMAYDDEDYPAALDHYRKAVELSPDSAVFHKSLADFYYVQKNDAATALKHYAEVLKLAPTDQQTLLTAGHICLSLQDLEQARTYYTKVIELDPTHEEVSAYLEKIDDKLATSTPSQPSKADGSELYERVRHLTQAGDKQQAVQVLQQILTTEPENALAHNDLGVLSYELGDMKSAQAHYEKAASLAPEELVYLKNLADFYYVQNGQVEMALQVYVRILKLAPKDVATLLSCAQICLALVKTDDARDFVEQVLSIEPGNEKARELLAQIDAGVLNPRSQDKLAETGTPDPASSDTRLYSLAQQRSAAGDIAGAIDALSQLLAKDDNNAGVHNDLGVLSYEQGQAAQALHHYERAVALDPDNAVYLKNLADFYLFEEHRVEDAMRHYVQVLKDNPEDVHSLMASGHISGLVGQSDDAAVFFRRVLDIEPWHADAKAALDRLGEPDTRPQQAAI